MSDLALRYETEIFVRCCDLPPKVQCCDCPNGISSIWEIQESLEGMYSHEFFPGFKQAWGCEKFAHPGVRRVEHWTGPFYPGEPNRTGECHWSSVDPQPGICCQFGCNELGEFLGNATTVSAGMSCYIVSPTDPIEPIYGFWLDCACDDLWVGDSSEWSSLEDCQLYDSNCHCSNDNGAFVSTDPEDGLCDYTKDYYEGLGLTCGECEWRLMQEGYPGTPGYISHVAGLGGPCACNRGYVHLNPLDPFCKDMLDSVDSSNLEPYNCEGCNTYVLIQYHATYVDGTPLPPETYPCCLGCGHLQDGTDVGCNQNCGFGHYYCLGYPATITLCPAESINPPGSDSDDCNPDVLCCQEMEALSIEAQSVEAPPTPPEDSIHFSFMETGTSGYLKKDTDGIYRGSVPPIKLEVNRDEKTLNGKKLTMLSDEVFIGRGRIGGEQLGFWVEVMA